MCQQRFCARHDLLVKEQKSAKNYHLPIDGTQSGNTSRTLVLAVLEVQDVFNIFAF